MPLFRVCYPPCNIRRKSFQNLICVMVAFGTLLFRFPVFFRIVFAIVSISFHLCMEEWKNYARTCFHIFLVYWFI